MRLDANLPEQELTQNEIGYWHPGGTALHALAAGRQNGAEAQIAEALISRGAEVKVVDQYGDTALMVAVGSGKLELVKRLLGVMDAAAILRPNQDNRYALELAVGKEQMLAALTAAASVAGTAAGAAALHRAAYDCDSNSMRQLLDAGLEVDAARNGVTALLYMSQFWDAAVSIQKPGQMRCWRLLLDRGASVHAATAEGKCALHYIAQYGDGDAMQLLLSKKPNVNARDGGGRTPLMYGASEPVAEMLIREGANVSEVDHHGYSPFDWAVMSGAEAPGRFLGAGAESASSNAARLVVAVQAGRLDAVTELLEGTSPETCDGWGTPVLHRAAVQWDPAIVEALLAAGAPVDLRNKDGRTALFSVLTSSPNGLPLDVMGQTAEVLLRHGASVANVDAREDSAGHVGAHLWFDAPLAAVLIARCQGMVNQSGETLLMRAVEYGNEDHVRQILAQGGDVNATDEQGRSVLFRQSARKAVDHTILLLGAGADINLADHQGVTPLMMVARCGDLERIRVLISRGARLEDRNRKGRTARAEAIYAGQVDAANLLLRLERDSAQLA